MNKSERVKSYYFLIKQGFKLETLERLNNKNLAILTEQYKNDPAYQVAVK